jgi:hypothetical protein
MRKVLLVFLAVGFLVAVAAPQGVVAGEGGHQYVGIKKCKMCHMAKKKGAQFTKWQETSHSKAYEVLTTDEAKAIYAKVVGEEGNPAESDKCLKCHVTGHGAPAEAFAATFDKTEGVGCEVCHGPGSDYMKMNVMKDLELSKAAGLIVPDEKLCVTCHNSESPTFESFDYKAFLAKIVHPVPPPMPK